MDSLLERFEKTHAASSLFKPEFFRLTNDTDLLRFNQLLNTVGNVKVFDQIESQLRELVKAQNPAVKLGHEQYQQKINEHLEGATLINYGVWVYYPWNQHLVHVLDEKEFVELRTNRNQYKITSDEQECLRRKKIGIIGLSVGQSIALTLAMERTCGELRLADFDTIELSNLNRIRTGIHNLGLKKTIIAAREISEIDPFIEVKIFSEGLKDDNMDSFFSDDGKIDLLVEVCDGLDIKIVSRYKARELGIPVVMDTNDRGLIDIERFDLEPEMPILHGLAEGLDPVGISDLTSEEKIPYILRMVNAENISPRLKATMIEVEQSVTTWPQLASSVVLGGAVTTDVCRRILLDQLHESGRHYIDLDELIVDREKKPSSSIPPSYLPPEPLSIEQLVAMANQQEIEGLSVELSQEEVEKIIVAATKAPSGGNCQPWKFVYVNSRLFLFHDLAASYSFLDYNSYGAYIALGAAIENICIKCDEIGYEAVVDYSPLQIAKPLVAIIGFQFKDVRKYPSQLSESIDTRVTNRNISVREDLSESFYSGIQASISSPVYEAAALEILKSAKDMTELGDILATAEKLVLMHPRGHFDAFKKELRWTKEENREKRDGLDVSTLGISKGEISALRIANDHEAIEFLRETIRGGNAFKKMATKAVAASSALGIVSMPDYSDLDFLIGGRAVERIWLEVDSQGVSFQPITQFTFLLARLVHGMGEGLDDYYKSEFNILKGRFSKLLPGLENRKPVFIFRLCKAELPEVKSLRKPLDSVRVIL